MRYGLTAAFAAALAGLVGGGLLAHRGVRALAENDRWVAHTHEVLAQLGTVQVALAEAESGQRGYLLAGDETHLAPYAAAVADLPAALDRLQRLTADNPRQQARIAHLRPVAEERLDLLREGVVARHQPGGDAPAAALVRAGRGRAAMDDLRRMTADMEAEEDALLRERSGAAEAAARSATVTLAALTAAGVSLLAAILALVLLQVRTRDRSTAALAAAHDTLERQVRERTAELEGVNRTLRASEERFRLLVDGVRDYAIYMLDPGGRVVTWNAGAERIKGYAAGEVVGRHFAAFYGPEEAAAGQPQAALEAAAAAGRSEGEGWRYRRDGTRFWANAVVTALRDPAGRLVGFSKITRDLTASRRAEEQLRQAQKMEAVGHLAGGVAHDFNNLLTVINGYADLLAERVVADPRSAGMVGHLRAAGGRAAALTGQLLAFSRQSVLKPTTFDLGEAAAGLRPMLARLLGEDVRLEVAGGPVRVRADRGQVEQVLMNLCVNARDAMPDGGRISVTTGEADLDAADVHGRPEVAAGRYARLAVGDTGTGMTDEVKGHLFEPFFTTKAAGKGTGLGLATVFGIVKQSGGHVEVDSEVGRGTTVAVYLPLAPAGAAAAPAEPARTPPPRGREGVLLVEDEEGVRALAAEALRGAGYAVLEAADGAAAEAAFAARPGAIDLLLTDVVMPGGNGRVTAERLAGAAPGLRVLYTSGYPDDAVLRRGIQADGVAFLPKPFGVDALLHKVRQVLDAPGRGATSA